MASFLSATEQAGIRNVFSGSFDTWSRNITIYKEPIKTPVAPFPITNNNLFGFGEEQQETTYTYTDVTGVYPAIIKYGDIGGNLSAGAPVMPEPNAITLASTVLIKVRPDARHFINNGPTSKIIVDGREYVLDSDERLQTFCGSEYYVFSIKKTE